MFVRIMIYICIRLEFLYFMNIILINHNSRRNVNKFGILIGMLHTIFVQANGSLS